MDQSPTTPERRITVKNGDTEQVLFMSYGLLSRLTGLIGGADQLPSLGSDTALQEQVILEAFTTRDKKTITFKPESLDEIEVDLDDINKVLDWVGAHVTDFFTKRVLKTSEQAVQMNEQMVKAVSKFPPIKIGSSDSTSSTAAASHSPV